MNTHTHTHILSTPPPHSFPLSHPINTHTPSLHILSQHPLPPNINTPSLPLLFVESVDAAKRNMSILTPSTHPLNTPPSLLPPLPPYQLTHTHTHTLSHHPPINSHTYIHTPIRHRVSGRCQEEHEHIRQRPEGHRKGLF